MGVSIIVISYQLSVVSSRESEFPPTEEFLYTFRPAGAYFVGDNLGYSNIRLGNFQGGLKNGEKLVE